MKKYFYFNFKQISSLLMLAFGASFGYAQTCGMDHHHEAWRAQTPNYQALENVDPALESRHVDRRNTKRIIPVVFHVLHTNGTENISNEQILDQLRIINLDFNKLNPDVTNVRNTASAPFAPLVADMQIEFVLAKISPTGECTNGINRIFTPLHVQASDQVKQLVRWNVNNYLNIWVVSTINGSDDNGEILGYANFPFMSATTDGIVIKSTEIGSIGTGNRVRNGRTLTHEIGHYLGLLHPFQGGCTGANPGAGIADIPPVATSNSNRNCPAQGNSCPNTPLFDMWENYMDYSLGCQYMFSNGQKARSDYWLRESPRRANLISESNLRATGVLENTSTAPKAFFESDRQLVCVGEPVTFFDNSCQGIIEQRAWVFEGANIVSSSQPSPTVVYSTPGTYRVRLQVANSFGTSAFEQEKYITVVPNVSNISGVAESFEATTHFSLEGIFQPDITGYSLFEKTNQAGYFGSNSIVARIDNTNAGSRYVIETPYLDISKMAGQNPKLSFMVAHARRNTSQNDFLRIYVSADCGHSWTQRLFRVSGQFSANTNFVSNFAPTSDADWMRVVFGLFEYEQSTNLKLRIEVESGGGNPVYIDDINVSQYFTSVPSLESKMAVQIAPNPSNSEFKISINTVDYRSMTQIHVYDVNGRQVASLWDGHLQDSDVNIYFNPRNYNLKSGIYILKIKSNEGILTKKLIFAD